MESWGGGGGGGGENVSDLMNVPLDEEQEASGEEEEDDWEVVEAEEGCDGAEGDTGQGESKHVTRHARRGKLNLLKSLHINRLKKSISTGEDGNGGGGQEEKKHLWKIPKLPGLRRGLSKERREASAKTQDEGGEFETEAAAQEEEQTTETEDEEEEEGSDRSQPGETGSKGSFQLTKLFQPHLLAIGRRGRSKVEGEVADVEEEGEKVKEEGQPSVPAPQGSWRARRTRRARRLTRGRRVGHEGGAGSDREDGEGEREAEVEREAEDESHTSLRQ